MLIALLLLAGLFLLYLGADWLIKGSSKLALRAGIPSLVVGLTIVAFGTSAPELAVSIKAGIDGAGDLAIGNVVGSTIFNSVVILGLSALVFPVTANSQVLRIQAPIMVAVSIILLILLHDKQIDRLEAVCLTIAIVLYIGFNLLRGRKNPDSAQVKERPVGKNPAKAVVSEVLLALLGLGGLVVGSRLFVSGATELARTLNISEAVIGLTIVGAGTGMPELATSIVAALKGEKDLAIGNVVGSNIFNMLGILGIAGMLTPLQAQGIGLVDLGIMVGSAILLLPLMRSGFRLVRAEGVLLLLIYGGYLWYLWP